MARTQLTTSQRKNYSPNLESDNLVATKSGKVNKILVKTKISRKKNRALAYFWRFMLITSMVFSFGGLGFGIALRYGQTGMMVNYLTSDNQPDLVNHNQ